MLPNPTWFAGCGNMAGAMIAGWRSAGADLSGAVAIRPSGRPVDGVRVVTSFADAGAPPRLLILGFKPQQLREVAATLAPWLTSRTIVVSLLAGVELATLRGLFPNASAVVRTSPNLPVAVRRGVVPLYGEDLAEDLREQIGQMFAPLGFALWTDSEANLAAIGAVAAAGPAYVARFIDALAKAAMNRGLSEELSRTIALETVLGTSWMAAATGEGMDEIARRVASPNGTTEAGLAVLDTEDVLDKLVSLTISAAARRGAELAEEAKSAKVAGEPSLS